ERLVRGDARHPVEQSRVDRALDLDVLRDVDRRFRRQLLPVPDAPLSRGQRNVLGGHQAALSPSVGVGFTAVNGPGLAAWGRKSKTMTTEIGLFPVPFHPEPFRERDRPA